MESTENCVKSITLCLKSAAEKSVPSKTIKFKGPKKQASQELLSCLRTVKEAYKIWDNAGKPRSGELFIGNKLTKRALCSQQSLEESN